METRVLFEELLSSIIISFESVQSKGIRYPSFSFTIFLSPHPTHPGLRPKLRFHTGCATWGFSAGHPVSSGCLSCLALVSWFRLRRKLWVGSKEILGRSVP